MGVPVDVLRTILACARAGFSTSTYGRAMYHVNIKLLRLSRHHRLSREHSHRYLGSISSWSWPPEPVSIG